MPDSFYDTQTKIGLIKDSDTMMQFENLQLMIDLQQPQPKQFKSSSPVKPTEPPIGKAQTANLLAAMLFLSHSKLSIKLRYILSMYRVDRHELGEDLLTYKGQVQGTIESLEQTLVEIDQARIEAKSEGKGFEAVDIRTRQTLFTQDCGGQGQWNNWKFQEDQIR